MDSSNPFESLTEISGTESDEEEKPEIDWSAAFAGLDLSTVDFSGLIELAEDRERELQGDANFSEQDILKVFSKGVSAQPVPKTEVNAPDINQRPKAIKPYAHTGLSDSIHMVEVDGFIMLGDKCIGRTRGTGAKVVLTCDFPATDVYTLNEEVSGKGMSLGFSSLMHSLCLLLLCSGNKSVMEPLNGGDVDITLEDVIITTEVTGRNFLNRFSKVPQRWVINKYLLCDSVFDDPDYMKIRRLSVMEEDGDNTMFDGTNLEMEHSEYTEHIRSISKSVSVMTVKHFEGLVPHLARWYNEVKTDGFPCDERLNENLLSDVILSGLKNRMKPSEFRVLPNEQPDLFERTSRNEKIPSEQLWEEGKSSYHTKAFDELYDYHGRLYFEVPCRSSSRNIFTTLSKILLKHEIFACIECETSLLMRIDGPVGTFWSDRHQVGISWKIVSKDSLVYNVNFFQYDKPVTRVGRWSYNEKHRLHVSPSCIYSREDLKYSTVVWPRVVTVMVSLWNLTGGEYSNWSSLMASYREYWSVVHNSTFMTSSLAGDQRFFTTRHMTGMSFNSLINRMPQFNKKMRPCDLFYLQLMERYCKDPPPSSQSPIFRFPLRFSSLEKDIGVMMHWNNRKADHETKCCLKMIKGAREEIESRAEVVEWYRLQSVYFSNLVSRSVSYQDTKELLDKAPQRPAMCYPFMAVMIYLNKKELEDAAASQSSTNFRLVKMISDRGSTKVVGNTVSSTKVVDAMRELHIKYKPKGAHDLMIKLVESKEDLSEIFAGSSKNGRGYREISTQKASRRVFQCFTEEMSSTISLALPDDALKEKEKYCPMVNSFMDTMKGSRVVCTSEDRSFHCGNNHPEALSVISLMIKACSGVNSMTTVSAIQRHQISRHFVLPNGFDRPELLDGLETKLYDRKRSGKRKKVSAIKLHYHMMQGMQSTFVGLVNTVFSSGLMKLCKIAIAQDIYERPPYVITTSDDVGKCCSFNEKYDLSELTEMVIIKPLQLLRYASQLNNWRKMVLVDKKAFVEVNNIGVTDKGMVPQTPVHAALIIQPLNGLSPLQDLMNIVNNARSTIFYGDPPNVAWSAFETMLQTFMSFHRVPSSDMEELTQQGLLPKNMSQLLEGFVIRSRKYAAAMINCTPESKRHEIITGERKIHQSILRKTGPRFNKEDDEDKEKVESKTGLDSFDRVANGVYSARLIAGRLRSAYARPSSIQKKIARWKESMRLLNDSSVCDEETLDSVMKVIRPVGVKVGYRPMKQNDFKPTKMGEVSKIQLPNAKRIECSRRFGIVYRTCLSKEETEISAIKDDLEYQKAMNEISHRKKVSGWLVPAPGGRPPVMFNECCVFTKAHVPFYRVNTTAGPIMHKAFTFKGEEVSDVKPCLWGDVSLSKVGTSLLSFCIGRIGENWYAFYKKTRSLVQSVPIDVSKRIGIVRHYKDSIGWISIPDRSPVTRSVLTEEKFTHGFLHGNEFAIVNYGGYLQSNSGGFDLMNKVFHENHSDRPSFVRQYLKPYPHFSEDCVEFPSMSVTKLIGCRSVLRLKFSKEDCRYDSQSINLLGRVPVRVHESLADDEFGMLSVTETI